MAEPAQQFLLTPEQETAINGVLAKHQRVSKAFGDGSVDADAVPGDALRENVDAETGDNVGDDEGLDARSLAALKAVFRILQPFKGQITEDMVDDVLAELDLDGTGEDGQDTDEDDIGDDDADDDTDDTLTEDDQAMAEDKLPDEFKKAADSWSPSKLAGMSDEDFSKAVAAAKSAFNNIGKAADNADDEDDGDKEKAEKSAVTKSLLSKMAPEHAELVRKADNARYEAIAKAAALEERVAKMEGERILKSYEEDIKKDCIVLGKDPVEQARILKGQYDADREAGEQYRAILRDSARMTHESGVFKTFGTSHNSSFGGSIPSDGQGSPRDQMRAMERGVVQKGEATSEADAMAICMKSQRYRDLYELDRKGVH